MSVGEKCGQNGLWTLVGVSGEEGVLIKCIKPKQVNDLQGLFTWLTIRLTFLLGSLLICLYFFVR
jgi:hypothetical protein